MALQPGNRLGRYEIAELLGKGGMGEVYRARDSKLGREVAIKVLPEELRKEPNYRVRLEREARSISKLQHPHVCTLHDFASTEDIDYLVMEYLEGDTLAARLSTGPLSTSEMCTIGHQVADAIDAAHLRGLVHRDLKPSNVMLTKAGVKVLDFGLAKEASEALATVETQAPTVTAPLTSKGSLVGTMPYMAPEQLEGKPADSRTDIWALGCLLYEMATGQRPFNGDTQASLISSIMAAAPEPPSRVQALTPKRLDDLVGRCLEREPARRWQTAKDVATEIESLGSNNSGSSGGFRRRWMLAFVAVLVGVVGVATWYGRSERTSEAGLPGASDQLGADVRSATALGDSAMILVLPFRNLGDSDQEYFASGVTQEIRTGLAKIPGVGVIAGSSSSEVSREDLSVSEVSARLGVDYVLDGTVRWAPDHRVRVSPELVRVSDEAVLWSGNLDHVIDDVFEIQSEISAQVAERLDFSLLRLEAGDGTPRSTSPEAIRAYLRGRNVGLDWPLGIELYTTAVELDPDFAIAWARLSNLHSAMYLFLGDRGEARLELARRTAAISLDLAPDLPETRIALGDIHRIEGDLEAAKREYEVALRGLSGDGDTVAHVSYFYWRNLGDLATSRELQRRAISLDPLNGFLISNLAITHSHLREYEEAERLLDQAISIGDDNNNALTVKAWNTASWKGWEAAEIDGWSETSFFFPPVLHVQFEALLALGRHEEALAKAELFPPEGFVFQTGVQPKSFLKARVLEAQGDAVRANRGYEEARRDLEKRLEESPEDGRILSTLGVACAKLGRTAEAVRYGSLGVDLAGPAVDAFTGPGHLYDLARIYAVVGDSESALDHLEELLERPGPHSARIIEADIDFGHLRNQPRYRLLMERLD